MKSNAFQQAARKLLVHAMNDVSPSHQNITKKTEMLRLKWWQFSDKQTTERKANLLVQQFGKTIGAEISVVAMFNHFSIVVKIPTHAPTQTNALALGDAANFDPRDLTLCEKHVERIREQLRRLDDVLSSLDTLAISDTEFRKHALSSIASNLLTADSLAREVFSSLKAGSPKK